MIQGVLLVLKIIGIVLLGILSLILLLIGLILFIPIRYKVNAKRDETIEAEVKITWLLHLLSIHIAYAGEMLIIIRFLGIPIYDIRKREEKEKKRQEKEEKKEKKKIEAEKRKQIQQENADAATKSKDNTADKNAEDINREDTNREDTNREDINREDIKTEDINKTDNAPDNEKPEFDEQNFRSKLKLFFSKIKVILNKILKTLTNSKYTAEKIYGKIIQVINNFNYYIEIWQREEAQKAFVLCKHSVIRIWKQMKPKKLKLYLHVGTDDPAITGQILVFYSMLYPYIAKNVIIEPEFDEFVLEGKLFAKGAVTVFVLLCVAWNLFFDKNIRKVWKLLNKEEL